MEAEIILDCVVKDLGIYQVEVDPADVTETFTDGPPGHEPMELVMATKITIQAKAG